MCWLKLFGSGKTTCDVFVLIHSSFDNPFQHTFGEILSLHYLLTNSVIMLGQPNSTIILKGVMPDDACSNTTRFEKLKK